MADTLEEGSRDWPELAALVDQLLDAAPQARPALIEELAAGDGARRAQLERLLAECEREPAFLSQPAGERFASLLEGDDAEFPAALAERYRLVRELGRGGMATVYLARDVKHARDVAVKVVRHDVAAIFGRDRFLREIEIVAQIHHPHIVPLYDSGDAGGSLYYVMPFEPGMSVRQRLSNGGPLPIDEAVLILRDVCDALAHAHQQGIVHRDIKPDNVLVSGRHAMVTDFGVAKVATQAMDSATATGVGIVLGTPAYMAPEQLAADPDVDHRADIYAVGVLAYELIAGHLPYGGDARRPVTRAAAPPPLTTVRADVPEALSQLVMKCLALQPEDRWQSAEEVLGQLESLPTASSSREARRRRLALVIGVLALVALAIMLWRRPEAADALWRKRWANARIERLTDFPGSEVDAAISADGRFVAFLADRDSVFDAFVTQVGGEQFVNLTHGRLPQLFNEDVRNVGFSADVRHVWLGDAGMGTLASVSRVPTAGGEVRPFLATAVMAAWSPDGKRVAYHETTPGDPIYVADADGRNARRLFVAAPGLHCHHLAWSPDGRFLYFSHGVPPNEMDIWRVPADGTGAPERITSHSSRVAYPVLLDDATLLYSATADDGTGPWLYTLALNERRAVPQRVSTAVEHYISVAASGETPGKPRRLVASVSNPTAQLWSVPITDRIVHESDAIAIKVPTARAAAPRLAADASVLYLASRGGADGVWQLNGTQARELWKAGQGAVVGAAAISPDGKSICFPVRRQGRSTLTCTDTAGAGARAIAESLDVRGAPSWSPDGRWIAVAAKQGLGVRVFKIPVNGGAPTRLVDSVSSNPVWSPDGRFILYSGTPRARSVPVKAVTPEGQPFALPELLVDRVGDSYRFLPSGKEIVIKAGGFRRQDFWLFDVATGQRRQLTSLRPGESLQRFDVSPDGRRIVFERVRENSDIVLIELPPR